MGDYNDTPTLLPTARVAGRMAREIDGDDTPRKAVLRIENGEVQRIKRGEDSSGWWCLHCDVRVAEEDHAEDCPYADE